MAKLRITRSLSPADLRAAERASDDRTAGRKAERIAPDIYRVPSSSSDATYTVRIIDARGLRAECDCTAGARGLRCRHAANALIAATSDLAAQKRGYAACECHRCGQIFPIGPTEQDETLCPSCRTQPEPTPPAATPDGVAAFIATGWAR